MGAGGGGAARRRRIDDRIALAAILYVLDSGCAWDELPASFPISSKTTHRRFTEWVALGVMAALHQATLDVLGAAGRIDWSRASIDAMHVRAVKGDLTGPSPVDRGKPGSKVHAISDRNGLPLHADITAANVNDHKVLQDVVDGITAVRQPCGCRKPHPGSSGGMLVFVQEAAQPVVSAISAVRLHRTAKTAGLRPDR